MNKPAPTNNRSESATCTTISPLLKRDTTPVVRRLCLSEVAKSKLVERQAGARPNSAPVSSETVIVKTSTLHFRLRSTPVGRNLGPRSVRATSALLPQKAKSTPTAPPNAASNTLSVSSCRTRRQRPAPTASRVVISALRKADRASNRFATLAHAISSTSATTMNNP